MKYVYLIYEDWHGLIGVCATPEKATELVKNDTFDSGLPKDTPLDWNDEARWGWEGAAWWVRREVIE